MDSVSPRSAQGRTSLLQTLLALFKVRIVSLLLFAAMGGAFLATGGWPGESTLTLLLITGGLAAGGASALNEYLEKDRDALMARTSGRRAALWILVHTLPTSLVALQLVGHPELGWIYFGPVAVATLILVLSNARLVLHPTAKKAFSLFKLSNLYLALVLLMICVDTSL